MGDEHTTPDTDATTDTGSVPNRLRQFAAHHIPLPSKLRAITAAYGLLLVSNLVGIAAAQAGGGGGGGGSLGSEICGTAITQTINGVAPIVIFVVIVGGLMLCWILHAWSGFKKDPQQAKAVKDWRNRAGITAISAPLLGKALEIIIGIMGLGLAGCIDIVPGI